MNPRLLLLLLVALTVGAAWLLDAGDDGDEIAAPVQREPRRAPAAPGDARRPGAAPTALLPLRERRSTGATAPQPGRLFAENSWAPPPPKPKPEQAAPAPVAPALPFSYVGRQVQGGKEEVFLAEGEKLHVVRAGSVIAGRYRVESVAARSVTLIYLPLNQTQQLLIRAGD